MSETCQGQGPGAPCGGDKRQRGVALARFLLLVACSALAGACGESDGKGDAPPSTAPVKQAGKGQIGNKVELRNGHTVQLHAYDPNVPGAPDLKPDPGKVFVAIDVEGCAGAPAPGGLMNPFFFSLQLPDQARADAAFPVREPALHAVSQAAGECNRGWVTFEISKGSRPSAVLFSYFAETARWDLG